MTIVRIIGRLILRRSPPSSTPRWLSTDTVAAETATAAAAAEQPSKRNLLYDKVAKNSSKVGVANILNKWVDDGNQVKRVDVYTLSKYFRNRRNYNAALQLYNWMDSSNLEITNADQAIRIDLLSKAEGAASAEKYFDSLHESEKTNKTYGALLSSYCRERVTDKALEIFEKMKVLNYTSTLNYNNVMSFHYSMEQPEKVVSLAQEMEEKNITADIYTYNLLINSYGALKNLDAMQGLVKKMESSNMIPDMFTYGNLATVYFNSGSHDMACAFLELMEKLETQSKQAAFEAFRTRLRLYSMMNNSSGVHRTWKAIKSAFPTPSNTSYLLMLLALSKLGDKEYLEKIYKEWKEGYSVFDFRLPSVLLEYYLDQNMIEEATSLYQSISKRAEEPNLRALSLFANLCIKNCQIDLALKHLDMGLDKAKLRNNKWFPSDETIKSFVNYFEANNDADRAEKFAESMKKHSHPDSSSLLLNIKVPETES